MIRLVVVLLLSFSALTAVAQLPPEATITQDGRLVYGSEPVQGFYDINEVHKIEFILQEPNWFELMDGTGGPRGTPGVSLIGQVIIDDIITLDSVEISIKGQTSDSRNRSEKKSFSIKTDTYLDQDIMGYDNLNLNCAFEDESGMREVLYYDVARSFTTSLKGSFVDLYINGQSWGPYNNIQQIEGRYISEWFQDNDGTRWRAVSPDGVQAPGGRFGVGKSTLNYNGPDSSDYNLSYTLKKYTVDNPWQSLIDATQKINEVPLDEFYEEVQHYLDIDKTLWFLIQEVLFSDDDSYIFKGGMDYYVYWDITTDRILPMEVDGNSIMNSRNLDWSIFRNEEVADYPLMNRMLQVPEIRQRYLAHLRTALESHFVTDDIAERIDIFAGILDQRVQDDPKKLYSYAQFTSEVEALKTWIENRRNFISGNSEVSVQGLDLSDVSITPIDFGMMPPEPNQEVAVQVTVDNGDVAKVNLYFSNAIEGVFDRVEMWDDGAHNDQMANDGIFGGTIPGYAANEYVRLYVEAIADDGIGTATYLPKGAEHDVFIYQVEQAPQVAGSVVINEFMASNDATVQDGEEKYEDWIELYNKGNETVDLTGFSLSDDVSNISKWAFPNNLTLQPNEYLIIWADDDENDTTPDEIHASFKLSAGGESILLVNDKSEIIDQIDYVDQETNVSMARKPNGTGAFAKGEHTFGENNDGLTSSDDYSAQLEVSIAPNPSSGHGVRLDIQSSVIDDYSIEVVNSLGEVMMTKTNLYGSELIENSTWSSGTYWIHVQGEKNGERTSLKLVVLP